MSVTLRAADLPAPSRMDWWRHTLDEALGPLEVRQPGGLGRRDQLLVGRAGAVLVGELSTGRPGGASRTRRHIRRLDLDVCKVDVLAAGRGVVQQQGRQADLRPGDLTLVDLSRPVRWVTSPMRMVAVVFPRSLLPLPPDEVAQLTAVRVPGDRGAGALASSLARQLPRRLEDCGTAERARLGVAVVDLLTAALAARLQHSRQVPPDAQRRALLQRVDAFIEQRLGDAELSPATIAAAHHVSVRYLYKLFEAEGQPVAELVRRRRLERCRRDLLDPALAARPVSAIGARWGLPDPAHFSRAFRAAYGVAPSEYRTIGRG